MPSHPSNPSPSNPAAAGLAARIKEIRRHRGRTQEAVAEELGVNYRHLQKIEGGKADFKLSTLARFASLFEIEPCFLANTTSGGLFKALALPCQSLMLDSLSLGFLVVDAAGAIVYSNRRTKELLERAKEIDASGKALAGLFDSLKARAAGLGAELKIQKWHEEIAGTLRLNVEAQLLPSPDDVRQALFLLESDVPFETRPIRLAQFQWQNFLDVPARNVRCYRRAKKMTQSDAAEALGMNLRYYQKIESGKLDLKCSTLAKVANTFNVQTCQLLVDEGLRPSCAGKIHCVADVLDRQPYGVIALGPRGELAYANDAYFKLIGRQFDPGKHKFLWDLLETPAEIDRTKAYLESVFRDQPPPVPYQRELTRADGTKTRLVTQWSYLVGEDNRLLGGVGLVREDA